MALFPVTLSDANYTLTIPFSILCIAFHNIFVVGGDRDYKFGR